MSAIFHVLLLASLVLASLENARADSIDVTNSVSVSAETGGNHAGTVNEGKASINIEVEQTINGVAQPPIIVSTSAYGGDSVKANVRVETIDVTTTVTTDVRREEEKQITPNNEEHPVEISTSAAAVDSEEKAKVDMTTSTSTGGMWASVTGAIEIVLTTLGNIYGAVMSLFT